jgi:hypothetical protein
VEMRVERMKETEEYKIKERIGEARGRAKNDTGSVLGSEMLQLQEVRFQKKVSSERISTQ